MNINSFKNVIEDIILSEKTTKEKQQAICDFLQSEISYYDWVGFYFKNGEKVKLQEKVKYLGCLLNKDCNLDKEVKKRIATCMITLKKLDIFWRHSDCPIRFKLIAQDAVIRSKLLYGLDTAQLNESQMQRIDLFQLKGLRKVLNMKTTFGQMESKEDRTNNNQEVFRRANEEINKDRKRKREDVPLVNKEILPFPETY